MGKGLCRSLRSPGFTLMELVIVVAIIGILAAIAFPSYSAYMLRSNRTVAKTYVSDLLSRQESFYSDRKRYAASLSELFGAGPNVLGIDREGRVSATGTIYNISIGTDGTTCPAAATAAPAAPARAFRIFAVPVGRQTGDARCATLCISSAGYRGASGTATDCWTR